MNPRKELAKLAPAPVRMLRVGDPGTGGTEIAWDDLVAAMPEDPLARLLLQVKWGGLDNLLGALEFELLRRVEKMAFQKGWGTTERQREILVRLVKRVVAEGVTVKKCAKCRGQTDESGETTGHVNRYGVWVPCGRCGGSGLPREPSGRERARAMGVAETSWRECWKERFETLQGWMRQIERVGLVKLRRNLGFCCRWDA